MQMCRFKVLTEKENPNSGNWSKAVGFSQRNISSTENEQEEETWMPKPVICDTTPLYMSWKAYG